MQGITLLFVGKTSDDRIASFLEEYVKRTSRYLRLEVKVIPEPKTTKKTPPSLQKELEGVSIIAAAEPGDEVLLLDERGQEYTSAEFAALIGQKMSSVRNRLLLVVGGPYGFSEAVYRAFPHKLSLSKMTMNHQMVRLLLAEQVYRAISIIHNLPYHHE